MVKINDYTCLEPYVGIRGICEDIDAPLCLNDIPGVEARTLVQTATSEDLTGIESFRSLRREAAVRTGRDFLHRLKKKYNIAEVAERRTVGDINTTHLVKSGEFTITRLGPQTTLHLEQFKVWASEAGEIEMVFNCGEPVRHPVTCGYNTLLVTGVSGDVIKVCITGVGDVHLAALYHASTCGCDCASLTGAAVAIVTFSLRCDHILCLFAEDLAFATRYMTAALLMEQVEFSDRKNLLARNSKESAGRIRARILGGKDPVTELNNSSLYWQEINQAVQDAVLDGPCVTCNGTQYIEQIP